MQLLHPASLRHSCKGSAMVELVLILPILCTILFGIIEFGIVLSDKNILTNASREGARYGIIPINSQYPTTSQVQSYITSNYTSSLVSFSSTAPTPTITVTSSVSPPVAGATITVTVSYPYTWLLLNNFTGLASPFTLSSTTVMIYE